MRDSRNLAFALERIMKICHTWNFAQCVHVDVRRVTGCRVDSLRHRRTVSFKAANIAEIRRREGERILGVDLLRVLTLLALMVRGDLEPVIVGSRFPARRRVEGGRGRQMLFRLQKFSLSIHSFKR